MRQTDPWSNFTVSFFVSVAWQPCNLEEISCSFGIVFLALILTPTDYAWMMILTQHVTGFPRGVQDNPQLIPNWSDWYFMNENSIVSVVFDIWHSSKTPSQAAVRGEPWSVGEGGTKRDKQVNQVECYISKNSAAILLFSWYLNTHSAHLGYFRRLPPASDIRLGRNGQFWDICDAARMNTGVNRQAEGRHSAR